MQTYREQGLVVDILIEHVIILIFKGYNLSPDLRCPNKQWPYAMEALTRT